MSSSNNAGITSTSLAAAHASSADWDDVLQTNLTGTFLLTQALMGSMIQGPLWPESSASPASPDATGQAGQANYAATKARLIGFTQIPRARSRLTRSNRQRRCPRLHREPDDRRVIEAANRAILSHIPLGHVGSDADVANAVAFLASDGASYITGHVLDVNGGMYMELEPDSAVYSERQCAESCTAIAGGIKIACLLISSLPAALSSPALALHVHYSTDISQCSINEEWDCGNCEP